MSQTAVSQRAEMLARQFEGANQEVIATVEGLSDRQWRALCEGEGWTVAVTAHHIAVNYGITAGLARAMTEGQAPAVTWEMLHDANARHAEEHANATKEETLEMLRRDGERAAATIRGFSDAELDRTAVIPFLGDEPVTVATFIEAIVTGHIGMHLPGIKVAARS